MFSHPLLNRLHTLCFVPELINFTSLYLPVQHLLIKPSEASTLSYKPCSKQCQFLSVVVVVVVVHIIQLCNGKDKNKFISGKFMSHLEKSKLFKASNSYSNFTQIYLWDLPVTENGALIANSAYMHTFAEVYLLKIK